MRPLTSAFEEQGGEAEWLARALGPRGPAEAEVLWLGGGRVRSGAVLSAARALLAGAVGLVAGLALGVAIVATVVGAAAVAWLAAVAVLGGVLAVAAGAAPAAWGW